MVGTTWRPLKNQILIKMFTGNRNGSESQPALPELWMKRLYIYDKLKHCVGNKRSSRLYWRPIIESCVCQGTITRMVIFCVLTHCFSGTPTMYTCSRCSIKCHVRSRESKQALWAVTCVKTRFDDFWTFNLHLFCLWKLYCVHVYVHSQVSQGEGALLRDVTRCY